MLRLACFTALCALTASLPLRTANAGERPSVLLIAVDDLNNDLGCYGHPRVQSPNIDRLAKRGVRFDRAYCQYPLCNPSRTSMLSGLRPDRTRVFDLETPPRTHLKDVVFLPQYFRQQGYYTAHIGKIFHTGANFEDPPSWDDEIRETGKQPPESAVIRSAKFSRGPKYSLEWNVLRSTDAETADGVVGRQGAERLRTLAAQKKPFFLAVGFRRPHSPYAAPQKYFDLYPPQSIPPLDEPPGHLARIPAAALTYPAGKSPISPIERAECISAYHACITFMDAQVGQLLAALDDTGLWNNTVVVFYSDHGYHLGEHGGMWHKQSIFEESARVPLIVAAPGVVGGKACPGLVELIDVYPTLVDLCNLPSVAGLDGQSLRPLLANPDSAGKAAAYSQVLRGEVSGRSLRTDRWRYTEWDEGRAGAELYDHRSDPHEYVNLADDAQWSQTRSQLSDLLRSAGAGAATASATDR